MITTYISTTGRKMGAGGEGGRRTRSVATILSSRRLAQRGWDGSLTGELVDPRSGYGLKLG
jgi:hypothetical protein